MKDSLQGAREGHQTSIPIEPKNGRPPIYSPELADRVLEHFVYGGTIAGMRADKDLPSWNTLRKWRLNDREFSARYARAREAGAEIILDRAVDVCRAARTVEEAHLAGVHLKATKWLLAVTVPQRFGRQRTTKALPGGNLLDAIRGIEKRKAQQTKDVTAKPPKIEGDANLETGQHPKERAAGAAD